MKTKSQKVESRKSKVESRTMPEWVHRLKPAAPARVHVLLAAAMWTVVGTALGFFGLRWVWEWESPWLWPAVILAMIAGLVKSRLILNRAARRVVARIRQRGDGRCIGGFVSPRSWLSILLMIAMGRVLRGGLLPHPALGLLYVAVGSALLGSSVIFWRAWARHHRFTEECKSL